MGRFRLRYQSTDLEMPIGDFVVGRSSSCHLALDDALVSRRHAVFRVSETDVSVEDLGSRNGVVVNGTPIRGAQRLKHLDRVVIGAQELLLIAVRAESNNRHARPTVAGMTLDLPVMGPDELVDEPTVAHRGDSVLDRIADKAIALGRYDEAERMLSRRLQDILTEVTASGEIRDEELLAASTYALRLAAGTSKAAWVEWIFQIHDAADRVVDAETIDALHNLVRRIRYPGGPAFRSYLAHLRGKAALTPAQRFLLKRLEALERVIGA